MIEHAPQGTHIKTSGDELTITFKCPRCGAAIERVFRPGVLISSGFWLECSRDCPFYLLFSPNWELHIPS